MISTQSPGLKRSTASRPVLATVTRTPLVASTVAATVALSRDHLKVAFPIGPPS